MSETGDKIVITNRNYYDQILSAVKKEDKKKFLLTNNPFSNTNVASGKIKPPMARVDRRKSSHGC